MNQEDHRAWKKEDIVRYNRIHREVIKIYGKATEWKCICGAPAKEWAWEHNTDPEQIENYWPRCVSCHKKYDYTDERRKRDKTRGAGMTGKKHSEDTRLKMSESAHKRYERERKANSILDNPGMEV